MNWEYKNIYDATVEAAHLKTDVMTMFEVLNGCDSGLNQVITLLLHFIVLINV